MSIRNLEALFEPKSVAVIGASTRPRRVGSVVLKNLLSAGFEGPVMPVNPKYQAVAGVLAYPDIARLPIAPDLAVICTPPETVPGLVAELGARGTRAAIVLTAGLARATAPDGRTIERAMLDAARPHLLRILGPNCLGLIVPRSGLNASFSHQSAEPGRIAFVSQSGALCTAVLDWAHAKGIGFSHFVSLGDSADVDFGDVLDYLGGDPSTGSILLYIEAIRDARKFMSAARAAARNKPVLAIKAGRFAEGAKAAASHTGAMAGADHVYEAAIQRTGMLRVFEFDELFAAVETLARARVPTGDRLAILTNGGGPAVMATDALIGGGGKLAELSSETIAALDRVLPATWSRGNPVDIIGDAPGVRYREAMRLVASDPSVDAVLALHAPTAVASAEEAARAVIEARGTTTVLASWLGGNGVESSRRILTDAGLPSYDTPDQAVQAFLHLVRYRKNQELLMETPPAIASGDPPDVESARSVIRAALAEGRDLLSEPEAKQVLSAFRIPAVETRIAPSPVEAERIAAVIGFPIALKILSPDVSHKSDVGGVVLDLETGAEVRRAAEAMLTRLRAARPNARLTGFTVQPMARRPGAHELIIGATTDAIFGPVILFGQGGTAVEVIGDRAVGFPPLSTVLARNLIERTRVYRLLKGYRDRPAVDFEALTLALMRVSELVTELGEVLELDVNPLLADDKGVLALDARIRVRPPPAPGVKRLAIRPYPRALEERWALRSGAEVLLRPIRPEDEHAHQAFLRRLEPDDVRSAFFGQVRELPHSQMARYTQIDYDREMTFIAIAEARQEMLGVVRMVADPDNREGEFQIVVRSDHKHQGLGRHLMEKLIRYARDRGMEQLVGQVLAINGAMLSLVDSLGFERRLLRDPSVIEVRRSLT